MVLELNEANPPLLVELLLGGARISGLCQEVGPRRRLAEVLNTPVPAFQLHSVVLTPAAGAPLHSPQISVEKKAIIAAIPHETQQQDRQRVLETRTVGRADTTAVPLVVYSSPFLISGTAHCSPGYSTSRLVLHADPALFPRFFSMTAASVTMTDGSQFQARVVLVNRDLVSAMGRPAEAAAWTAVA